MTLIYELDRDMLKMYLRIEMHFLGQGFQKLEHYKQTDTQTDTTENITRPHSQLVNLMAF